MTTPSLTRPVEVSVCETFAATPDAVPRARALTHTLTDALTVAEEERDTAALVVTELVTNAVTHADTATVTVEVKGTVDGIRVAVTDDDVSRLPRWGDPDVMDSHGRGLLIIECLCSGLSCVTGAQCKTVFAVIDPESG